MWEHELHAVKRAPAAGIAAHATAQATAGIAAHASAHAAAHAAASPSPPPLTSMGSSLSSIAADSPRPTRPGSASSARHDAIWTLPRMALVLSHRKDALAKEWHARQLKENAKAAARK